MLRDAFLAGALVTATPVMAEWSLAPSGTEFRRVGDRDSFVEIVSSGQLSRFGIKLRVEPDGRIEGRAFGVQVSGSWQWQDGYFCRDLAWGRTDLGPNCQEVTVAGNLVRFTSDRGKGDFADLKLD